MAMAHQSSSAESHDQIPSHLNTPHPSKDIIVNVEKEQQDSFTNLNHDVRDKGDDDVTQDPSEALQEETSGRERLNRHRVEVAGRVWIPDIWGQEDLLKDWIDCAAFDAPLVSSTISSAREALVQECTRPNAIAARLRIENRC
ncbi:hypothetical protein Fmac_006510 [Flemingia macrophylla]|uniref:Protein BIC1 n=1 Tax=Flemingia macrophylla TaxID=520843 RepID=A0ABD1NAV1_9FABA